MRSLLAGLVLLMARCTIGQDANSESLIETLVHENKQGFGYSCSFNGSLFSPFKMYELHSGASKATNAPVHSDTIEAIVRVGLPAVPSLLNHLDDSRITAIGKVTGHEWINYSARYDTGPSGENGLFDDIDAFRNLAHSVTVGDLCFVALGQIVNRNYQAIRFQPTGGVIVNSPTALDEVRSRLRREWSELTLESHREGLIRDFKNPDSRSRRIGAYYRLALFYPDVLGNLVVAELSVLDIDVDRKARNEAIELLGALVFDQNELIKNKVRLLYESSSKDDAFAVSCLTCLLKRDSDDLFVLALSNINTTIVPSDFEVELVRLAARSKSKKIADQLLRLFQSSQNDDLLIETYHASKATSFSKPELFAKVMERLNSGIPYDGAMLSLMEIVAKDFPSKATELFNKFLADRDIRRIKMACRILSDNEKLSISILKQFLSDRRMIDESARVGDFAAAAICTDQIFITFDFESSIDERDAQIDAIQKFCDANSTR